MRMSTFVAHKHFVFTGGPAKPKFRPRHRARRHHLAAEEGVTGADVYRPRGGLPSAGPANGRRKKSHHKRGWAEASGSGKPAPTPRYRRLNSLNLASNSWPGAAFDPDRIVSNAAGGTPQER